MTTVDERSTRSQRTAVYVLVAVVLGGLLVAGYLAHRSAVCTDLNAALTRAASDTAGGPGARPLLRPVLRYAGPCPVGG
ncbi:hypothetical protein [Amycolatopsis vancoresmycina]|uniref:Uncharacterized protein n=1 Tax=Amycolatopsis vancoresmycina DSM 44592 TaxID=1292037 RepID=R1HW03_9PSEU|nr:hypothetical protein [Amycolatopsis vancoresmycina]EOD64501.1 hypothetical protein H480_31521 [Amycolatopsis vancoresmycina DSM 44592]